MRSGARDRNPDYWRASTTSAGRRASVSHEVRLSKAEHASRATLVTTIAKIRFEVGNAPAHEALGPRNPIDGLQSAVECPLFSHKRLELPALQAMVA